MIKVITIGFENNEVRPIEGTLFANHQPGVSEGMTKKEYILKCQNMAIEADVLIVNSLKRTLEEDEVVLIYSAYTTATPIFVIGNNVKSPLLEVTMTNSFQNYSELVDHLNAYYLNKKRTY